MTRSKRIFDTANSAIYDAIGRGYAGRRVPDPRIAARIRDALGAARRICNVGAGTGCYEPADRQVIAVEPSLTMIAQRTGGCVVRARAEALPFADGVFDAATALMTVHHWQDLDAGIAELRRIAPRRVIFTFDPLYTGEFWLARDYLPEIVTGDHLRLPRIERLVELLGGATVHPVPVPWDCSDGFLGAYWRRPERYLDPQVRASISALALLPEHVVERGMARLADDLASGAWAARNEELLGRDELDLAYGLVVSQA